MEDQRVSGVFKPNAKPHHRFGSSDRIFALCVLRDRGKVSGTNSRDTSDIRPRPETSEWFKVGKKDLKQIKKRNKHF